MTNPLDPTNPVSQLITTINIPANSVGINADIASASSNSLILGTSQYVGIGTITPVVALHIGEGPNPPNDFIPALYITNINDVLVPPIPAEGDGIFFVQDGAPMYYDGTGAPQQISTSGINAYTTGTATLPALGGGIININNPAVTMQSKIFVSRTSTQGPPDSVGILGSLITAPGVFVVYSTVDTDTSSFNYLIVG